LNLYYIIIKIEFLLIGLKRQLAKIQNPSTSIDTTQSARNPGFTFDQHFLQPMSAFSKSCYHHIRALRCIRLYLDLHTANAIATSSYTPSLTTATLYYGLPKYQTNPECSCSNCCPGSQNANTSLLLWNSLAWSFWTSGVQYFFSHNILNTQRPYLYDVLVVKTHALRPTSLWSNHLHHSKSLIFPSDMLHLIFETSFLHHSEFLIQIIHLPLSDLYLNMPVLTCYTLLSPSITFSLFHSELKTYLFRKSHPPP